MSYLVFARKWRPLTFEQVLAQDHITVTLKNAIKTKRIGHAFLFAGPRGVGKTTTARILAKALNCSNGPTSQPCGKCESCIQITTGTHLDVLEIDGASNRGIDEIRELRENARYATISGCYKIYIIDEVHMLTKEAFNALLKILEEPPDHVVFIFATTEPRKIPSTIISRCQRYDFRRIPVLAMMKYIKEETSRENIDIDDEALRMVCRASGGSMRDALSLMDQLVSFAGDRIKGSEVIELLGIIESDLLAELASAILSGDGKTSLEIIGSAMDRGYSVEELTDTFIEFLRNLLLTATGAELSEAEVPESEIKLLERVSEGHSDLEILNILRLIAAASSEIKFASLPRVSLESAVLSASRLSKSFSLSELSGSLTTKTEKSTREKEKTVTKIQPSEPEKEEKLPEHHSEPVSEKNNAVIKKSKPDSVVLSKKNEKMSGSEQLFHEMEKLLPDLLRDSTHNVSTRLAGKTLTLFLKKEQKEVFQLLTESEHLDTLVKAASEAAGYTVKIDILIETNQEKNPLLNETSETEKQKTQLVLDLLDAVSYDS